jgi:hypothetical protein
MKLNLGSGRMMKDMEDTAGRYEQLTHHVWKLRVFITRLVLLLVTLVSWIYLRHNCRERTNTMTRRLKYSKVVFPYLTKSYMKGQGSLFCGHFMMFHEEPQSRICQRKFSSILSNE